jgi:hypothetical protein
MLLWTRRYSLRQKKPTSTLPINKESDITLPACGTRILHAAKHPTAAATAMGQIPTHNMLLTIFASIPERRRLRNMVLLVFPIENTCCPV